MELLFILKLKRTVLCDVVSSFRFDMRTPSIPEGYRVLLIMTENCQSRLDYRHMSTGVQRNDRVRRESIPSDRQLIFSFDERELSRGT